MKPGVSRNENLREYEAISVDPVWVLWVEAHEFVEEDVRDWGHTHGRTRVARVGFQCTIDLRIDRLLVYSAPVGQVRIAVSVEAR